MKKIFLNFILYRGLKWNIILLLSILCITHADAQISEPQVWFRFKPADEIYIFTDEFGNTKYAPGAYLGGGRLGLDRRGNYSTDRFNNNNDAFSFSSEGYSDVVTWSSILPEPTAKKLFGLGNIPENFTLSCWVYADPAEVNITRKILYGGRDNSEFALMHKGSKIFLRRCVENNNNARFDYEFWSPASFDAGAGWYQLILCMSKVNGVKRTKLYVGKPGTVKYDKTGPRIVTTTTDPLASNFGGGYASFGIQNLFNSITNWGFGARDIKDDVNANIKPVQKIDDFMIWNFAVTDNQAKAIFDCQKVNAANNCFVPPTQIMQAGFEEMFIQENSSDNKIMVEEAVLYPNPVTNQFTVSLFMQEAGPVNLMITDLTGRNIIKETINVQKGRQEIVVENLKAKGLKSGFYMLKVMSKTKEYNFKFIVE
ncbi:T9SS type A sorting domain-containing protein [Pedobacter glucosidilyticus]|uniref:T9SS type A sorting domain-containing protein n=1 Tax=Pedobacter glucosidilyticus TaxID=1122941 RepID=UPI0026EA45D3|nr:T9SS type A sorting domain-containing protein [Pedobacter glucosidilyticus]